MAGHPLQTLGMLDSCCCVTVAAFLACDLATAAASKAMAARTCNRAMAGMLCIRCPAKFDLLLVRTAKKSHYFAAK